MKNVNIFGYHGKENTFCKNEKSKSTAGRYVNENGELRESAFKLLILGLNIIILAANRLGGKRKGRFWRKTATPP